MTIKPEGYEKDIKIFIEFLKSKNIPIITMSFQGIRSKDVVESIDYYIRESNLTSVSPVKRYASAISEFFKYIISEGYIDNKSFYNQLLLPTIHKSSYWGMIYEYILKDKRLKEKDTFNIFEKHEVIELINTCNQTLDTYIDYVSTKKYYNKVVNALCIKLISLTGILYRSLREIKITDDINLFNKIYINGFKILLPEKYSLQIKKYLDIRKKILKKNNSESDYLFITFEGKQLSKQTSSISSFLASCIGRQDLNGLIKYSIREMIMVGINDSVINRLTNAGQDLIKQALENENSCDELYWNRYLDSRLRNIEIFDSI